MAPRSHRAATLSKGGGTFHGVPGQGDRPLEIDGRLGPQGADLGDDLGFLGKFQLQLAVEESAANRAITGTVPLLQADQGVPSPGRQGKGT